jgi:hypothetical protein
VRIDHSGTFELCMHLYVCNIKDVSKVYCMGLCPEDVYLKLLLLLWIRVSHIRFMLHRAVSLMQEFIGDEDVAEGNEKPTQHSVSNIFHIFHYIYSPKCLILLL